MTPLPLLQHPPAPRQTRLDGLLGGALAANRREHLAKFITDEASPAIALFCPEHREHNHEGDWYGEHAGKWLCTAALAVERTGDPVLTANLRRVTEYLLGQQQSDGYLGTYAPSRRFMCQRAGRSAAWDGAPEQRTWDVWVHAYLILGLLAAGRALAHPGCLAAARRIGDLCWRAFGDGGLDITTLGNHHGLSATVLLDPAVELYFATGEQRYLDLARTILRQADTAPALRLLPQALTGTDAAHIATGKAYQLAWMLVGLVKLHRATGEAPHLDAALRLWQSIREQHLTLGGGPWGGVAHRSREVFNHPGVFSPQGYVETCSTFAWIQLNQELLALTGEARFAEEIEKSAYNDLLGAQTPAGDNWCYYSFPNGRRVYTTYWRCCKSSGPWALEALPGLAYAGTADGGIAVNLYGPGRTSIATPAAGEVVLEQETRYPFAGEIRLVIRPARPAAFPLLVRIPAWADGAVVRVNGLPHPDPLTPGSYCRLAREWREGDIVTLDLPLEPRLHRAMNRNIQESRAPDGSPVAQEVLHFDYVAFTRGPLVYSTALIDGFKVEESVRLPAGPATEWLKVGPPLANSAAPSLRLELGYRAPLVFAPYFEAGGRDDGTWRLTWLSLAPS